jgi:enoyl-CoA hydratase/carnithine racemase
MILVERLGADLLLVTLDRPEKRNALSKSLIEQLTDELRRADADAAIRGVVLAEARSCAGTAWAVRSRWPRAATSAVIDAVKKHLHQTWLELPYDRAVEGSVEPLVTAFRSGQPQRLAAERLSS